MACKVNQYKRASSVKTREAEQEEPMPEPPPTVSGILFHRLGMGSRPGGSRTTGLTPACLLQLHKLAILEETKAGWVVVALASPWRVSGLCRMLGSGSGWWLNSVTGYRKSH